MKVLIASHLYPSPLSLTYGSFVHNQARFLQEHCQLEVVAPVPWFPLPGLGRWSSYRDLPAEETCDGVRVWRPRYLRLPRRVLFASEWRSYLRALRGAALEGVEVLHAHCAYPDGVAAGLLGRELGIPVVLTVHGHDLKDLPAVPSWRRLVTRALEDAAAVVAVSGELAGLARGLGAADNKVHTVPNGVDGELFAPTAQRVAGEGGWRLLYVGRFDRAKGLGVLLQALAALGRDDISLTLVGGNPMTGSEDEFRRQTAELGLQERVEFVSEVPWERLPSYMAEADLFVLPSFSEGLPLVLLEAMSCGLPVVSTRCGGPEEIVEAEGGRLVGVGDVDELAAAIGETLDGYAAYDRGAIRRRALERYDYRRVAQRLASLYTQVAA